MKNIKGLSALYIMFFVLSCNSIPSSPTDKDSTGNDNDIQIAEDDATENDTDHSSPITDSDVDTQPPCQPALMEAPFPYYDKEGNMTFCRPGCDTPTEKDPHCMANLWKEQNQALCTQEPEYACCGLPCVMESLKPMTNDEIVEKYPTVAKYIPMHDCDLALGQFGWGTDGTSGVVKSWNMSDGKVGFYLVPANLSVEQWPVQAKFVTYDIVTKKYHFIAPARGQEQAYYIGYRIALTADMRSLELNNNDIYLTYIGDDGSLQLVYNKKVDHLSYEPALNSKWVFVNLREPKAASKMMYAKVGEWKWTILGEGYGWFPSLVGNHLSIVDDDVNGWICDLSKNPQKLSDCTKFNQEGEQVEYLYFDKEDENRFIFYNTGKQKLVLAEKDGDGYKRTDIITEFTEESQKNAVSLLPRMLRGDVLLYEEVTTDGSVSGGLLCFYNITTKKKQCMKKMDRDESYADGTTKYPYGYAEFEGKWLLYQKRNSTPLILRDMECYCKEEGICPFEE